MWMVLDESLIQTDPAAANVRSALEQLFYAVGRGEHAIAASPSVARHLLQVELSPIPKTVLRQVLDMAPDLLARLHVAKSKVRIVAQGMQPARLIGPEWSLPLEWIRQNGVPISCILGENMRDAELFRICAMHQAALVRTGNSIRLDIGSGGGADTPRVLATEIETQRRIFLCITDSDRACPCAPQSHTSNECARITNASTWISHHFALIEREIENLLPANLVDDVVLSLSPSDLDSRLSALREISVGNTEAWAYFDLKEGTPLRAMFGACCDFWAEFKDHAICRNGSKQQCLDEERCVAATRDECKCVIAPPLGQKILDHVCAYVAKHSLHATAKRSSTSINGARWAEIGAMVAEWGAAMPKLRS